jgi:hypothetical protein
MGIVGNLHCCRDECRECRTEEEREAAFVCRKWCAGLA